MTLLQKKRRLKENEIDEDEEIENLDARIIDESPPPGSVKKSTLHGDQENLDSFEQLPISQKTLKGLKNNAFDGMTEIQKISIPHALAGRDILGAARTGSGKTLAFLIPVLESLYRQRWSFSDGLGALIISPTRELALQIFDVLRKVGKYHSFSAGLVTGGKKEFREEQRQVVRMNILVATPGRLVQHLEQTFGFSVDNLQLLVLDEADRILDMGFKDQLNSILSYLPTERQTMLFSATQTKTVKDLSRLSLNQPEYIGVHDKESTATPKQLMQIYTSCKLPEKLDILFSFVKAHLKSKLIVFLSTCSQVRFVEQLFCKLRPGIPILSLHGKLKQIKRSAVYFDFCKKPAALLFATDIAARGLDFPSIDWVIQVDCPEDKAMYIHRAGRTARYKSGGKALLFLLESEEEAMAKILSEAKIPIKKVQINPAKTTSMAKKAAAMVASDVELKRLAQKAFTSYLRSVMLMPSSEVFRVSELPFNEYALSLGLATMPSTKFLREAMDRDKVRTKKNKNRALQRLKDEIKSDRMKKKVDDQLTKMEERSNLQNDLEKDSVDSDDDLLVVKKRHDFSKDEDDVSEDLLEVAQPSKKKQKKMKIRLDRPIVGNKKITFDEDGNAQDEGGVDDHFTEISKAESDEMARKAEEYRLKVKEKLQATKDEDVARDRVRVREKHVKKRQKLKGPRLEGEERAGGGGAVLLGRAVPETGENNKTEQTSDASGSADSSDESENENQADVFAQEEAILGLLRK